MSEAIVLSRREEGQAQKRRNLKRVVWVFLGVLLFLAVMELIVALLISPNLTIKHLIVESDFGISENEVLSIAGMERKEYYFSIKSEDIRERLAAYPLVRNARVE